MKTSTLLRNFSSKVKDYETKEGIFSGTCPTCDYESKIFNVSHIIPKKQSYFLSFFPFNAVVQCWRCNMVFEGNKIRMCKVVKERSDMIRYARKFGYDDMWEMLDAYSDTKLKFYPGDFSKINRMSHEELLEFYAEIFIKPMVCD